MVEIQNSNFDFFKDKESVLLIMAIETNYLVFLGMLDFKGKAKWDAWSGKKGTSQDDAKTKYVEYANEMVTKHGLSS